MEILQSYKFGEWFENISVRFLIRSDSENQLFNEISEFLGMQPDRYFIKGDPYLGKTFDPDRKKVNTVKKERPVSLWEITTNGKKDSDNVQDHIHYLLNILEPIKDKVTFYLERKREFTVIVIIDVSWNWHEKEIVETGFSIDSELLTRIAKLCHYVEYNFANSVVIK